MARHGSEPSDIPKRQMNQTQLIAQCHVYDRYFSISIFRFFICLPTTSLRWWLLDLSHATSHFCLSQIVTKLLNQLLRRHRERRLEICACMYNIFEVGKTCRRESLTNSSAELEPTCTCMAARERTKMRHNTTTHTHQGNLSLSSQGKAWQVKSSFSSLLYISAPQRF